MLKKGGNRWGTRDYQLRNFLGKSKAGDRFLWYDAEPGPNELCKSCQVIFGGVTSVLTVMESDTDSPDRGPPRRAIIPKSMRTLVASGICLHNFVLPWCSSAKVYQSERLGEPGGKILLGAVLNKSGRLWVSVLSQVRTVASVIMHD